MKRSPRCAAARTRSSFTTPAMRLEGEACHSGGGSSNLQRTAVVVSACRDSLLWLRALSCCEHEVFVYDRCGGGVTRIPAHLVHCATVTRTPNRGKDALAYFTHLDNHAAAPHRITAFVRGDYPKLASPCDPVWVALDGLQNEGGGSVGYVYLGTAVRAAGVARWAWRPAMCERFKRLSGMEECVPWWASERTAFAVSAERIQAVETGMYERVSARKTRGPSSHSEASLTKPFPRKTSPPTAGEGGA